jgi:hypothetical protein
MADFGGWAMDDADFGAYCQDCGLFEGRIMEVSVAISDASEAIFYTVLCSYCGAFTICRCEPLSRVS